MEAKFSHTIGLSILLCCLFPFCINAQIISTFAGNGSNVFSGDGGPATAAGIYLPEALAVDNGGNLYIASQDSRIRRVTPAGIISTVAGNGLGGSSGDGGPATNAQFGEAWSISTDPAGNLFIYDIAHEYIRKVDAAGIITTVAGNGTSVYTGDGGPATAAGIPGYSAHTSDRNGNLYLTGTKIRKVDMSTGIISYVAGDGTGVYSGDGGPATAAGILGRTIAVDHTGNIFIGENCRIRKIDTAGIITTIAGDGIAGFSGDGGPATAARLSYIYGMSVDMAGNIYASEKGNDRVRKINIRGIITTIAGNGTTGFMGDGGPATAAEFDYLFGVVKNGGGNIFIADRYNHRVRMVTDSNHAVHFAGGHYLNFNVCTASLPIDTLLAATDADTVQMETWNIVSGPLHGTAVAAYATMATGGMLVPTGLSYTPVAGYTGPDTLKVSVSDGYTTDTTIVYIRVDTTLPFAGGITGPDTVCIGHTITLTDSIAGGVWSGNAMAIVSAGSITGAIAGSDTISYIVTNGCGADTVYHVMTVKVCPDAVPKVQAARGLQVWPNPSAGELNVLVRRAATADVSIAIYNEAGQAVKETTIAANKESTIKMTVPGIYLLRATVNGEVLEQTVVVK